MKQVTEKSSDLIITRKCYQNLIFRHVRTPLFSVPSMQDKLPYLIALAPNQKGSGIQSYKKSLETFFYSLLSLVQNLGTYEKSVNIVVISDNLVEVNGKEELRPEKATILGPVYVRV